MKLNAASIQERRAWEEKGIRLPNFDREALLREVAAHLTGGTA